jgi:beta-lactamase regulating signal transducer with metallopeptidase domain
MMTASNVLAYTAQIMLLVLVCAGLPRLLALRSAGVQYAFWRVLLVVCLVLPLLQTRRAATTALITRVGPPVGASVLAAGLPAGVPIGSVSSTYDWAAIAAFIVLAGAASRLLWIGVGIGRLRQLRRRATPVSASAFEELRRTIDTRAELLWSPDVTQPVTFGILKPAVLLPDALRQASEGVQRRRRARALSREAPRLAVGGHRGTGSRRVLVSPCHVVADLARSARARDRG